MNRDRLNEMKKEYEQIEVPAELKNLLEASISRAKEENTKKEQETQARGSADVIPFRRKWPKRMAGGVVAALLALTILCNTSQEVVQAMENIPVLGAITKIVTFRHYKDKQGNYEANIQTPKVEDTSDVAAELNRKMEEYTNKIKNNYQSDIDAVLKDDIFTLEDGHESVDTTYTTVTDNERVLSIKIDTVILMAGSNVFSKCYTVDKQNGKILKLKDLFISDADYVDQLSKYLIQEMNRIMKEDDTKSFFIGEDTPEMNFNKIKKNQNFYINPKGHLVLTFDKYEIAPGYMGTQEFEIPTNAIQDIVTGNSIIKQ